MWEEKTLVTSIFSFSHNVFQWLFASGSLKVEVVRRKVIINVWGWGWSLNFLCINHVFYINVGNPGRKVHVVENKIHVPLTLSQDFKFDENGRKFPNWVENTELKEKLLVTSNFPFSHSVFKRRVLQIRKNQGLFEKGLTKDVTVFKYILGEKLFPLVHNREGES